MGEKKGDFAVIFDLDGVLVDTGKFHKQSWYDLAAKEGYEISDAFFRETFGMQNYQILPKLANCELGNDEIKRLSEWKESRYRQLIAGQTQLLGGVEVLLKDLKDKRFLIAIGTSTPNANLSFMLKEIPGMDVFDAYVTGEEVTKGKPAPDTFLAAAIKLDVDPIRCVVVEDAVAGVAAGKAAGMSVVAVTTTRTREQLFEADIIVDGLGELSAESFGRLLKRGL